MGFDFILPFDRAVSEIVLSLRSDAADAVMAAVTSAGDAGAVWIILSIGMICFKQTRTTGILMLAAIAATFVISTLGLKHLFARPRPCVAFPVEGLYPCPSGFSFPSGHTISSFAAAGVLFFRKTAGRWAAVVLAVLIAFSRVYLNVHYGTDVLAGALLGVAAAYLTVRLHNMKKAGTRPAF